MRVRKFKLCDTWPRLLPPASSPGIRTSELQCSINMNFASLLKSQRHQVEYVAMAPLLQLLSLFVLLSLCHSELNGGPRDSVCRSSNEGFIPGHGHGKRPNLDEEKYKVTISLIREKDNQTVDCVENSTRYIGTYFC